MGDSGIVTVWVDGEASKSERRFDKGMTIRKLKERLEPLTGVPCNTMKLALYDRADQPRGLMDDDEKMLGYYGVEDFYRIVVTDLDNRKPRGEFTDLSQVEKFEITEEEYDKKEDSVRAFKRRHKLGRFADGASNSSPSPDDFAEEAALISVGQRCEVTSGAGGSGMDDDGADAFRKRGVVKYVGQVPELKAGWWIGVEYDEPVGKHDGSAGESRYFTARPRHGAFVRPNKVAVGDFPEEDLDLEMDEI
ncbi:tubulin folding cofactor B [Hyaloraphidium curvatum]|nr:tubulin folding cofactor B [Hyaloraphidium curvatum]